MTPLLVALALLSGASWQAPQEPEVAPEAEQQANSQPRGTSAAPLVVEMVRAPADSSQTQQAAAEQLRRANNERWLVRIAVADGVLGVLLVVITGFLAIYTAKLWNATNTLAADAKDTATTQAAKMQASVDAAVKSAEAMRLSVKVARKALKAANLGVGFQRMEMEQGLRAYVGSVAGEFQLTAKKDEKVRVDFKMRNFGRTPAFSVETDNKLVLERPGYDPPPSTGKSSAGSRGVIWPGDTVDTDASFRTLHPHEIAAIEGETLRLYLVSVIRYRDAFGEDRVTGACRYFIWRRLDDKTATIMAVIAPNGNYAT